MDSNALQLKHKTNVYKVLSERLNLERFLCVAIKEYCMNSYNTVVLKAKYGDTLMRFRARIVDHDELDLNMDGLKEKILSLFLLTPDTELMLTYIDEHDDEVTLADDESLRDAVMQRLNPLKIAVHVKGKWSSFSLLNWEFYSFGISLVAAIFAYSVGTWVYLLLGGYA